MLTFRKNRYLVAWLQAIIIGAILLAFAPAALSLELKGDADYLPWSGWWWPKSKGQLVLGYNGRPSPAEKYDLYVTGKRPGTAYREGLTEWYDLDAVSWIGLCNGWVNASILESGPILPASSNGVYLTVGDKKGLLTACHFKDEIIYEYCSQSPEPFHRYLINHIGEQGEIIGADLDSSASFWSYPIYSYEMDVTSGEESDHVVCTIKHAEDLVEPDYEGTLEQVRTYRYRLYKDVEGNYDGRGEWLQGDPGDLHPQSVWVPVGIRQDELIVDYEEVRGMARTVDDELEGGELVPGHHLLIVYPGEEDTFTITPLVGENITCYLALDHQSPNKNGARYSLERNNEIVEVRELDNELHHLSLSSETGTDELRLRILPGLDNSVGVCVHLYVDVKARYQSLFYGFPAEPYWLGCAVAGLNETEGERVWLEIVGDQGLPLGCGAWSGESLKQGGRWLTSLENRLTIDYFSGDGKAIGFKLVSSTPYQSLLLAGDSYTLRGPSDSAGVVGSKLIIPWLTSAFNMRKYATFHLANPAESKVNTVISYFKNDGTPLQTVDLELAAETMVEYGSGDYPGQRGVDGWGIVESSEAEFSGSVVLKEGYNLADQLPLLSPGKHWIAPHLATDSGWQTLLGLCNPNPEPLTLSLTAFVDGDPLASTYSMVVEPFAKQELHVSGSLFGVAEEQMNQAWLRVNGDFNFAAYLRYLYGEGARASIPLYVDGAGKSIRKLSHLAVSGGWWTGIVLINRSGEAVSFELVALDDKGNELQLLPINLGPQGKFSASVATLFNEVVIEELASLRLEGAKEIKALVLYGGWDGITHLSMHSW